MYIVLYPLNSRFQDFLPKMSQKPWERDWAQVHMWPDIGYNGRLESSHFLKILYIVSSQTRWLIRITENQMIESSVADWTS